MQEMFDCIRVMQCYYSFLVTSSVYYRKKKSLCVQSGVDVSLIVSTHIMSCFYISNLFYKNDNHNLYTMLSLRLAIQLVHLTYFLSFFQVQIVGSITLFEAHIVGGCDLKLR